MSRTTKCINHIKKELDRISGLTGIVSDMVEDLDIEVTLLVQDILENHPNANYFDYYGYTDTDIEYNKYQQINNKYKIPPMFKNIINKIYGKTNK